MLLCFAAVALGAPEPYVRPKLVAPEDGAQRIVFEGLRHPCVERMEGVSFIKNGVSLVGGESTLQVVTGPNMGGKSTYIRSVGVAVLLAQIGSFVPADAAEISVCDSVETTRADVELLSCFIKIQTGQDFLKWGLNGSWSG